jgi:hypothetical protein
LFYAAFAKLFFAIDDDNPYMFDYFLLPFHKTLNNLKQATRTDDFKSAKFRLILIGLLRDLRGVLQSLTMKNRLVYFMEWLCGYKHLEFFETIMEALGAEDLEVLIPMLRFYCELVFNRNSRLVYDKDNNYVFYGPLVDAIASFVKTCTKIITSSPIPASNPYASRYKPISICLTIVRHLLGSNSINLGLFGYFGSTVVSQMIQNSFTMVQDVPISELLSYPKFSSSYFTCISVIFSNNWESVPVDLNAKHFQYLASF